MGGSKRRLWLISGSSAGSAGSASSGSVFQGPQYLTTLPSNMLKNDAGWAPKSLPGASGGLWGRSGHRLLFLRRKKAPAGALKTRIGFFFGRKRPARVLTAHIYRFFEGQPLFFGKKRPRGCLQDTYIGFFEGQPFFSGKNAPRGCLQDTYIGFRSTIRRS